MTVAEDSWLGWKIWPHWGDRNALRSFLDAPAEPHSEVGPAVEAAGRLLRSGAVAPALQRTARRALVEMDAAALAELEPWWDARCDELVEHCDSAGEPVEPGEALAICWLRDDLESVQHALSVASFGRRDQAPREQLDALERRRVALGRRLAGLDDSVGPLVPKLRRAFAGGAIPAELRPSLAALQVLVAAGDNPWWLDLVDAALLRIAGALPLAVIERPAQEPPGAWTLAAATGSHDEAHDLLGGGHLHVYRDSAQKLRAQIYDLSHSGRIALAWQRPDGLDDAVELDERDGLWEGQVPESLLDASRWEIRPLGESR